MNALLVLWTRASDEIGANLRLRLGLWAIAFILFVFFVIAQQERTLAAQDVYAAAADRFARAERLLGQSDWNAVLEQAQQRNERLRGFFWQANTPGLAEANLQAALHKILDGLEFRNLRIQSSANALLDVRGVWRIQAEVNASFNPGAELQLLYEIAKHSRKLQVDSLSINRNNRIKMLVSTYFTGIAEDAG